MGAGERLQLMERLHDMEKTIALLHQRVSQLQQEVSQGRAMQSPALLKGSCLRTLFGGQRQNGLVAGMVRQNRRVERHAASLF